MCNKIGKKLKIIILVTMDFMEGGLGRKTIWSPNVIGGSHLKPKTSFLGFPNLVFSPHKT
jgi:hypothetical protein